MMTKKYISLILLIVFATILVGCSTEGKESDLNEIPPVINDPRVIVDGTLLPINDVQLGFGDNGRIETIYVEEGENVSAGEILAQLENSETYQSQIENAKLTFLQAKNDRDDLLDNAPIAYAEAWQNAIDAKEIADKAQSDLDAFDKEDYQEQLDNAKADVIEAENDYQDAQSDFDDYANVDEDNQTRKKYKDALEKAEDNLNELKSELTIIENEYAQLEKNLNEALALLNQFTDDMTALENGPKQSNADLIEARIQSANAQILAAEKSLEKLTIIAPFDGIIMKINLNESEFSSMGSPILVLADVSEWKIETDNLTEFDVIDIKEGQIVTLEPEVYPGQTFNGVVTSIDQFSQTKEGDVTYTAYINIDNIPDIALRWGMSMIVVFE